MGKAAIAALTRGYADIDRYSNLIKRNRHIEKKCENVEEYDFLLFHEGNIPVDHQEMINSQVKKISFEFIDIREIGKAFRDKSAVEIDPEAARFKINYRHMCSFWFVDFWHYLTNYSRVLRIDEDCFVEFSIDDVMEKLNDYASVYGWGVVDLPFVTKGMNDFTLEFLRSNNYGDFAARDPWGPYTNIIGFNLDRLKENNTLSKYVKEIDNSEGIYKYRWGDLPLWGEVFHYMIDESMLLMDKSIKYYHSSHNQQVN